ncbi:glucose-6-phosphate isomerase [Clostridia bacterium]|nr:glucose-6-phosphate isomerase [Clostridia bacterium]
MGVSVEKRYLSRFIAPDEVNMLLPYVEKAAELLESGTGPGAEWRGWLTLPDDFLAGKYNPEYLRIKTAAEKIQKNSTVLFVIGIGGSYLGARAVVEAVGGALYNNRAQISGKGVQVYFAGNSISPAYLNELIEIANNSDFSINVVSKSGTTTEPAVAFRVLESLAVKKYGAAAKERIFATTDESRGTLKTVADEKGYETFVIPDDVGGRFSVLTAVGLLPAAAAGVDTDALLAGAAEAKADSAAKNSGCLEYAALRNILYRKGFSNELLVSYENRFTLMGEWFKQLFGESEGKDLKGIFPASATFSTDLHSLGQFIQDGTKLLFETVVWFETGADNDFFLNKQDDDRDGLNFLCGQNLSEVNKKAFLGTVLAHTDGGTPNIVLKSDKLDARGLGYLVYFFEKACAVSGYLLGVNPFDQPGVESYKKNMFALLGKPGYEELAEELAEKLKK